MTESGALSELNWVLLARYFAGQTTAEESRALDAQCAADPAMAARVAHLRAIWEQSAQPEPSAFEIDAQAALRRVSGRIDEREVVRRAVRPSFYLWGAGGVLAAAVAVSLTIGFPADRNVAVRDVASAAGSRTTLWLRDGTRVVLGPESHVRIPADFGRTGRNVELDGEAYFAVVHDDKHPFAVRARGAWMRDIGTEFDVRAYAGDTAVRVAVASGEVALGDAAHTASVLHAGDIASIAGTSVVREHREDLTAFTTWMQGGLVFTDAPLRDVVRDVGRTFGVTVTVADSALLDKRITAAFSDQTVDVVLDAVTRAVGARYERVGHAMVIRRRVAGAKGKEGPGPQPLVTARANGGQG